MSNTALNIRHKLFDYIWFADDKKLNAIYDLLEDEIERTSQWWKDKEFIRKLDVQFQALENGADEGFTVPQLQQSIDKLRKKKYGK